MSCTFSSVTPAVTKGDTSNIPSSHMTSPIGGLSRWFQFINLYEGPNGCILDVWNFITAQMRSIKRNCHVVADLHDSAKALISNDENLMNFAACIKHHDRNNLEENAYECPKVSIPWFVLSQAITPKRSRPNHLWNSAFQFCYALSQFKKRVVNADIN